MTKQKTNIQRFASVWDAIEDTPGEAAHMKARSELMIAISEHIAKTDSRRQLPPNCSASRSRVCLIWCGERLSCSLSIPWCRCWRQRACGWR